MAVSSSGLYVSAEDTPSDVSDTAQPKTAKTKSAKKGIIRKKKVPAYFFMKSKDTKFDMDLYFINDSDVPYIKLDDWASIQVTVAIYGFGYEDYDLEFEADGDIVTLTRENSYPVVIDFANDTLDFFDYDAFLSDNSGSILEIAGVSRDEDGKYSYIKKLSSTNERYGKEIKMDAGAYGIDFIRNGNDYFIPVQTASDIFMAPSLVNLLCNGKSLIVYQDDVEPLISEGELTPLGKAYYGKTGTENMGKISKSLSEFSYNELCFAFDNLYGLKEQHHIGSFDELVDERAFRDTMTGTDTKKIDTAIYRIINDNLDDVHSSFLYSGFASGAGLADELYDKYGLGNSYNDSNNVDAEFRAARAAFYPDGVPAYEEIGDTAFITFDAFVSYTKDYYAEAPTADSKDTIGIIAYSVQQILRENSPVKNVVLDLSCNYGGSIDAAIYTIGAFLGKASISVENPNTGALVTADYKIDTNFDRKFNSKDTLAGKGLNLYCLETKASFSCGNLVPAVFKDDSHVTLLGQKSGGGACAVMTLTTASGSVFTLSSSNRLSFLRNGSFYDIDQGVEPDFFISKKENFYDREALVKYINGLM